MTLKQSLSLSEDATWMNQDLARKNRISAIDAELERIKQQKLVLNNREAKLKEEKERLKNPSIY